MTVRDRLRAVAGGSQRDVLSLYDRWLRGGLSERQFVTAAAQVIANADQTANRIGSVAAAVQLTALLERQVDVNRRDLDDQTPRLTDAVGSVLAARPESVDDDQLPQSRRERLTRIARAEPLYAGQSAFAAALVAAPVAVGWRRATGPDPCPLCTRLADGVVRPSSVRMATHTGCSCVQVPARL